MKSVCQHRHKPLELLLAGLAVAVTNLGCDDLDRFSTSESDAYCGAITLGSAFREGFSPRVQMRLRIDASAIDQPGSAGTLSTYEAGEQDALERRILDEAPLRVIEPVLHDPISQLSFGDGRERNAIFAVRPSDPNAESLMAVVSFKSNDAVEVRLLRPGISADDIDAEVADNRRRLFGLFPLTRQDGDCGF